MRIGVPQPQEVFVDIKSGLIAVRTWWRFFHDMDASADVLNSVVATDIASKAAAVNTNNKRPGLMVFDSTNNRIMVASGESATDAWYVADGSASVTPS